MHEPNNDWLFPGRLDTQVTELEDKEGEWAIDRIVSHKGSNTSAIFECVWKSGDRTWVPYPSLAQVGALRSYLEVLGLETIAELNEGTGVPPEDDPQVYIASLMAPLYEQASRGFPTSPSNLPKLAEVFQRTPTPTPAPTPLAMALIYDPSTTHRTSTGVVYRDPQLDRQVTISFSQLRRFFYHDLHVRDGHGDDNEPIPAGYIQYAQVFNNITALEWLQLNHKDYSDVEISLTNLDTFPTDCPPVTVIYQPDANDDASYAVFDGDENKDTDEGMCTFAVQALTVDKYSKLNRKGRLAAAITHLKRREKVISYGQDGDPQSLYNNPDLYPGMFPWLFPYGLGGIDNPYLLQRLSRTSHIRRLLSYHDKQFQEDGFFIFIAWNQ